MLLLRASWLALVNWGITMAAKMPRMITTIRISTSVKPLLVLRCVMTDISCSDVLPLFPTPRHAARCMPSFTGGLIRFAGQDTQTGARFRGSALWLIDDASG